MRTLAQQLTQRYSARRLCAFVRALNEHAALQDGLFESNVLGQPYVGFGGIVLTAQEKETLAGLTEAFNAIMTKALAALVEEPGPVLRKLGWPENLEYALRREPLNRTLTPVGRFDFALDTAGEWRLMEFNSDTPSGSQEVSRVEERQWSYLANLEPGRLARLNPVIARTMAQALYDEAMFDPAPAGIAVTGPRLSPKVGFLVQGRHLTDLAQVTWYAEELSKLGLECVVGDISNLCLLGGQLYLLNQHVDAIYRLFPVEYLSIEPLFAAYEQANLNGWLKCLNNLRGFFAQSKAVMAWVWMQRGSGLFTAEEQEIIERHLPETYLLEDLPENFDYSGYIIKEFYGREGAEVYNGATLPFEHWQQCRTWRTYVAQRRIEIAPVEHVLPNEAFDGMQMVEAFPCVGGYIIGGSFGGCYTRIGGRITDSFAQFIPTLMES
ncbi:MAG TPA: glutathionylspermidine synthase family protein [Chloroflexia bacterium]|nr:glutathionylspermidine synthase family protein [Chloroflexia bacterium]